MMNRLPVFLTLAALLMLTSFSFGQGFVACLYDAAVTLTTTCGGNVPLPEGTPIQVFVDANGNGPDDSDPLATVCQNPPDCSMGPAGTLSFNSFLLNGEAQGIGSGMFFDDPCLASALQMPTINAFFLKITTPTCVWTSGVFHPASGLQDMPVESWTCMVIPNTCDPIPENRIVSFDCAQWWICQPQCVTVSHIYPVVHVVVRTLEGRLPVVSAIPLCGCCPDLAAGFIFDGTPSGPWVWDAATHTYNQDLVLPGNGSEGCTLLSLDWCLPATMKEFSVLPYDNAVSVQFATASETNIERFDILRNGTKIGSLAATNRATGSSYEYTDRSALNGNRYEYSLAIVTPDGVQNVVATQSATPYAGHALVTEYALHQNYPNPFNPSTTIRFDLPNADRVTLKVFAMTGQEVATLVNGNLTSGAHQVEFNGNNLPSGLYFYTMKTGSGYSMTHKMLLVK